MDNGWEQSAAAWIADMGETGDFSRRYVLDPVMLERALSRLPRTALDVGCGEGRFCRILSEHGIETTGLDPTAGLIEAARRRDPGAGHYVRAAAEQIPFAEASFDLVVSYLSLIDIADIRGALPEMARVLRPAGSLLIANLTSFATAGTEIGWVKDAEGRRIYYPIDRYLEERPMWIDYRGIRVRNYHRPMRAYFQALLGAGLRLEWFDEPLPVAGAPAGKADGFVRAPWFLTMQWSKPARGAI